MTIICFNHRVQHVKLALEKPSQISYFQTAVSASSLFSLISHAVPAAPGDDWSHLYSSGEPLRKILPVAWDLRVAKQSPANSDLQISAGEQKRSWQFKTSDAACARNQKYGIFQVISYRRTTWSCYISVCPSYGCCSFAPVPGNDDQKFYRQL